MNKRDKSSRKRMQSRSKRRLPQTEFWGTKANQDFRIVSDDEKFPVNRMARRAFESRTGKNEPTILKPYHRVDMDRKNA